MSPGTVQPSSVVDTLARGLQAAGHDVLLVGHPNSTCPVPTTSAVPAIDTSGWAARLSSSSTQSARASW